MRTILRCLFILPNLLTCLQIFSQAKSTFGTYKDWTTTETRVWGMVRLTDTIGREFDRITSVDSNTIKIEEYNPAGTLTSTTTVRFAHNHLSTVEYTNQWGLIYRTVKYVPDTTHIYRVTDIRFGKNDYLPCKEARHIYKNDLLVEAQYISYSGKLCNNINGIADIIYVNYEDSDRYGRRKEMSYFDEDGSPTTSKGTDYHRVVYDRDKHGNILSTEYYDEEGHKLQNRSGTYNIKNVYDSSDNKIESNYCGVNGEVKKNLYGVAKTKYEYRNGLETQIILYDDKNNIVKASDTGSGVALTRLEYNSGGFVTSKSFFNEKQEPMNNESGIHRINAKYNNRNMLIEEEYFDKAEAPTVNKENIHRYAYGRDDKGREIATSFFDINNEPTKSRVDQVYMVKYNYNINDQLESESFWKNDNTKMRCWTGHHKTTFEYNDQGLQTIVNCYDEDGKLLVGLNGYSRVVKKYDSNARICEYSRFDGNTPSVTINSTIKNYHSIKLTYDEKNRITQIAYLDTNEKPTNAEINLKEGFICYKIELKYVANRLTQELFYPKNTSYPTKVIDCLKEDFVDPQGITFGHKNRK